MNDSTPTHQPDLLRLAPCPCTTGCCGLISRMGFANGASCPADFRMRARLPPMSNSSDSV